MTSPYQIDNETLIPIVTVEQLAATVNTRDILMRQDRIIRITGYTLTGAPAGYVNITANIIAGQNAGQNGVASVIPITPETVIANLIKYYALGTDWLPGTQIQGGDDSRGTVNANGYISIWKSGSKFQVNTVVTFQEYGPGVIKLADPPA